MAHPQFAIAVLSMQLRMSEPTVQEEEPPLVTKSRSTESPPPHASHSPQPSQPAHNSDSDHTHSDSEDEGLLDASATGDEVTQLLRNTVEELELALDVRTRNDFY